MQAQVVFGWFEIMVNVTNGAVRRLNRFNKIDLKNGTGGDLRECSYDAWLRFYSPLSASYCGMVNTRN